jgi:hypothetical protein
VLAILEALDEPTLAHLGRAQELVK